MLIANALGLLTAVLQARLLGPIGRGEVAMALVPASILVSLLCFGMPDFFGREAARSPVWSQQSALALRLSLLVGIVSFPFYFIFIELRAPTGSTVWILLMIYAIATPVTTYGACLLAIAAGSGRITTVAITKVLPGLLTILGLSLLIAFGPSPLAVGIVVALAGMIAVMLPLLRGELRPKGKASLAAARGALRVSLLAWPGGAMAFLNQRLDLLLVSFIATKEEVGYYAVSATVAQLVTLFANSVAIPTQNLVAKGKVEVAAPRTARVIWGTVTVSLLGSALLPFVVPTLLGREFEPAVQVMFILLVAQVPMSGAIVLNATLVGAGRAGIRVWSEGVAVGVMIVGGIYAYAEYGLLGVATVSIVARLLSLVTLVELTRHYVHRDARWTFVVPMRR